MAGVRAGDELLRAFRLQLQAEERAGTLQIFNLARLRRIRRSKGVMKRRR